MKIKFTQNREEKTGVKETGRSFKKDEVYEVNEASAQHWINRGVAVRVPDSTRVTKEYDAPSEEEAAQLKSNAASHDVKDAKDANPAKDEDAKKPVK
jgi:hypothetical protein